MSLANRPTTPDEEARLRAAGFTRSQFECMNFHGNWSHPHWISGKLHVGPDEALALVERHAHELVHRAATSEEVDCIMKSNLFVRSPHRATSEGWMWREGAKKGAIETTDRALAYAREATPSSRPAH